MLSIQSELMKLQDEFQKDAAVYEKINSELHAECQALRQQTEEVIFLMTELLKFILVNN